MKEEYIIISKTEMENKLKEIKHNLKKKKEKKVILINFL